MSAFEEIYNRLAMAAKNKKLSEEIDKLGIEGYEKDQLNCLLNPDKYAPIVKWEKCHCGNKKNSKCIESCKFGALSALKDGDIKIDKNKCVGCGECEKVCKEKKFKANKELTPVIEKLISQQRPVYAIIAPAFIGQFSDEVTPGMLRGAFKKMGFEGMIEVALFADILTLKEALEFDKNVNTEKDFQLTSCCCPMWIGMIRKVYSQLMPHVPASVSPMIACGRSVKKLHPDAVTVFVGPCLAKKAEAREPDIKGAVDYVLTFQEVKELFEVMNIDMKNCEDIEKNHSSESGRIYARSGGVSEAVLRTLKKVGKNKKIKLKSRKADGIPACKKMINELIKGETKENFYEGMGCKGGCVGGPKSIVGQEIGKKNVNKYGNEASYKTPADNPYVLEMLHRLGYETIESLLDDKEGLFTRKF